MIPSLLWKIFCSSFDSFSSIVSFSSSVCSFDILSSWISSSLEILISIVFLSSASFVSFFISLVSCSLSCDSSLDNNAESSTHPSNIKVQREDSNGVLTYNMKYIIILYKKKIIYLY